MLYPVCNIALSKITGRAVTFGSPLTQRPTNAKGRLLKKIDITATALSWAFFKIRFQNACMSAAARTKIIKNASRVIPQI
jgi:hypothetical protein